MTGRAPQNPKPVAKASGSTTKMQYRDPDGTYTTAMAPVETRTDHIRAGWSDYNAADDPALKPSADALLAAELSVQNKAKGY